MSKNTKIILSVIGVLVVLFAARYAFQSSSMATNMGMPSKDGDGSVISGTSVPKDFPSEVTVYGNAKIITSYSGSSPAGKGHVISLETVDSPDTVISFYTSDLTSKGWKVVSTYSIDKSKVMAAQKGEMTVMVSATAQDGKTMVVLTAANM